MPHVILPAEHTDADLILASQIAEAVESAELFVTWTPRSGAAIPEIEAELRESLHPLAEAAALFAQGLAELWRALTRRRPAPARR
jgi:5,10-methenyltetrahydromethanopterin hydrogenase